VSRKEDESRFGDVAFGQELRRRREQAGLTLRALGELVDYNYAHVSKVETGAKPATREFATLCDKALGADGQLLAVWSSGRTRPRIAQLPAAPPVFLGRTQELRALDEIEDPSTRESARVVLIEGPAGVGKTALALTWAHRAAGRFPDGQLYADLHGFAPAGRERVDPDQVLEGFLGALGVDEVPATPGRRAALYRSILADQRLLIVLDNVADVTQVEPLLPGTSRCLVVVTSRARLPQLSMQVNLTRLTLDPLDDRQAVRLLAAVVGHRRADLDPGAMQELAHACSGLPLALRLAAERIASSPGQPVSEFAADISAGKQAGTAAINDDVVALREIFSWSYRALDEQAASMFRHLGLQRLHTVHASSVAALAGISRPAARGLLDRLAGLHLVQLRSPGRYTMLDHIWGYAAECASDIADPDRTMALQRLATWYLHSAWGVARALAPARYVPDNNLKQVPAGIEPETFATPA
jgi:transcriptional regulator with XRE-family HTH domain